MKTRLLKKLRAEARKTWTVGTDNFGQAWIYAGQVATYSGEVQVNCNENFEKEEWLEEHIYPYI